MSYTYKNRTDEDLTVIGVGVVKAGATITTDREVNNPNLELVNDGKKKPVSKDGKQ